MSAWVWYDVQLQILIILTDGLWRYHYKLFQIYYHENISLFQIYFCEEHEMSRVGRVMSWMEPVSREPLEWRFCSVVFVPKL